MNLFILLTSHGCVQNESCTLANYKPASLIRSAVNIKCVLSNE